MIRRFHEMKNRFMKRLAVIILLLCAAVLPVLAAPSTDYTLTGNQADDVITVAKAQVGKTRSDFGWNTLWCGYFAGWAGRTAGADYPPAGTYSANGRMITYWFVHNNKGMFYYFRDANYDSLISHHPGIKNKDHCIKSSLSSFIPQKGDIIMFLWNNADPGDNWSHVGLVESYANGKVYTVEGNVDNKVKTMTRTWNDPQIVGIVRPNYQDNSKPVLTIQFHANGGSVSSDTFAEDSSGYVTKNGTRNLTSWEYDYGHPNGLYNASSFGLTRSGYSFVGWGKNSGGTGQIFDEDLFYQSQYICPTLSQGSQTITLYAIWAANNFLGGLDGLYTISPQNNSAVYLSVEGDSSGSGARCVLTGSEVSPSHFFRVKRTAAAADLYTVSPLHSGLNLATEDGESCCYTQVVQAETADSLAQKWRFSGADSQTVKIRPAVDTGLCLNNASGTVNLFFNRSYDVPGQNWILTPAACVTACSLELEGKLGIRLTLEAPESAAKAVLAFQGEYPEIVEWDLTRDKEHGYSSSTGLFTLKYGKIAAKEMTCPLNVTVYAADGSKIPVAKTTAVGSLSGNSYTCCAADWAAYAAKHSSKQKTVALAKALLNYGGSAQSYFKFNLSNPANPENYLASETAAVTPDPALDRVIPSGAKSKLGFQSMALNLEGDTELQIKFSKKVTAVCGGKKLTVKQTGDMYYVSIPGIAAVDLDQMYTVKVTYGSSTLTLKASALSWCNAALDGSTDKTIITMCKALYLYNQKAEAYFGKTD